LQEASAWGREDALGIRKREIAAWRLQKVDHRFDQSFPVLNPTVRVERE
jgi:hypothetical protein